MFEFCSIDIRCKNPLGAIEINENITFSARCDDAEEVFLYIRKDGEKNSRSFSLCKNNEIFSVSFSISEVGLYWYYFSVDGEIYARKGRKAVSKGIEGNFQLTVYKEGFVSPDWIKGGIVYQIFPDRFFRTEIPKPFGGRTVHENWFDEPEYLPRNSDKRYNFDFYGGNFNGIKDKLDYLVSLSVSAIYLNPVCEAQSNHRYDTSDYEKFDKYLGTDDDYRELVAASENKGIGIIQDVVFSHTGDDSRYFNKYGNYSEVGAYQSKDSVYYNWYTFTEYPDKYECWWGVPSLPQTRENESTFSEYICGLKSVLSRFCEFKVKGFRLDVADELPDEFIKKLRERVKTENPEAVIIGEVWENASDKISYGIRRSYFQGEELDCVTNYPLGDAILLAAVGENVSEFVSVVKEQIDCYPKCVLNCLLNSISTHDTVRAINFLCGEEQPLTKDKMSGFRLSESAYKLGKQRLKLATLLQYTVYGNPCVYYGDEVGLQGNKDPFNRRTYPWGMEDSELLDYYRRLGEIRKNHNALSGGEFCFIWEKKKSFVYKRSSGDDFIYVAVNFDEAPIVLNFKREVKSFNGNQTEKRFEVKSGEYEMFYKVDTEENEENGDK